MSSQVSSADATIPPQRALTEKATVQTAKASTPTSSPAGAQANSSLPASTSPTGPGRPSNGNASKASPMRSGNTSSTISPTMLNATTINPAANSSKQGSASTKTWPSAPQLVGIILGGVIGIILVCVLWVFAYRMGQKSKKEEDELQVFSAEAGVSSRKFDTSDTPLSTATIVAPPHCKRVRFVELSASQPRAAKPIIECNEALKPFSDDQLVEGELERSSEAQLGDNSVKKSDMEDCEGLTSKPNSQTRNSANLVRYLHPSLKRKSDTDMEPPWWQERKEGPNQHHAEAV